MKRVNEKLFITIIFACMIGFILAKIDTSKHWDDTGITVALVLISSFILGIIQPTFAWASAIIIGGFIFSFKVLESRNYGSAAAILFAFIGAYGGVLFKKYILNPTIK